MSAGTPLVTVVMAVKDKGSTLGAALASLPAGCKDVPVRVLICDNGSTDPGYDMVHSPRLGKTLGLDVRVLEDVPSMSAHSKGRELRVRNRLHLLRKFVEEIRYDDPVTPFMFSLDADVCMPPGGLAKLVEHMNHDARLGLLGFPYPPKTDHVKHGCTLHRFSVLNEIAEDGGFDSEGCLCRWLDKEYRRKEWGVRNCNAAMFRARHLCADGTERSEQCLPSQA